MPTMGESTGFRFETGSAGAGAAGTGAGAAERAAEATATPCPAPPSDGVAEMRTERPPEFSSSSPRRVRCTSRIRRLSSSIWKPATAAFWGAPSRPADGAAPPPGALASAAAGVREGDFRASPGPRALLSAQRAAASSSGIRRARAASR
jgi:hypothetical protein